MFIPKRIVEEKLRVILEEDVGEGDVTAAAVIPKNLQVQAEVVAKENGIVAGIEEAIILAEYLGIKAEPKAVDGEKIKTKQALLLLSGDARTILSVERTLLNLVSRMSGIATKTRLLTEELEKAKVKTRLASTRKSAPGMLYFDKKAVILGGGDAHRLHLDDMVLIKDNHVAIVGSVKEAVRKAKANASFSKKIEVEVACVEEAVKAAKAGADIVMLDNFTPAQAKEAAEKLRKASFDKVLLEVSGGITSENMMDYAEAQVDIISMGSLTHSVKALDISLEIVRNKGA